MATRLIVAAVAAVSWALSLTVAGPAAAQSYPTKPIKLVVPFPPGGPIDTMARLVAQQISATVGQVIVENRPGAGSTMGSKSVASADPDGYTLLYASSGSLAIAPALYKSADIDPIKQFTPVALVSLNPHVMIVTPEVPANNVAELIAYAKANPGKLNYGAGLGTPPHLMGELFKLKTGTDIVYIPYKGAAASITDLLGGRTQLTIDALTVLAPLIREGKLKLIAVAGANRLAEFPNVPTLTESGIGGFGSDPWTGVVAPAGTPPAIVEKLNAAINAGLKTAAMQEGLRKLSAVAKFGTPAEFAAFLPTSVADWSAMVKASGAKVE